MYGTGMPVPYAYIVKKNHKKCHNGRHVVINIFTLPKQQTFWLSYSFGTVLAR